jgi:transposase
MAAPGENSFCVLEYHTSKSVVTVQRAFRAKYAKEPLTDKTIRAWCKQFTETGCLCKQKSSGRPLTAEEHENCIDVCRVTAVHTANISSCQKKEKTFSVFLWL